MNAFCLLKDHGIVSPVLLQTHGRTRKVLMNTPHILDERSSQLKKIGTQIKASHQKIIIYPNILTEFSEVRQIKTQFFDENIYITCTR